MICLPDSEVELTRIANDKSDQPMAKKVAANKPAGFVDACYPTVAGPLVGAVERVTGLERCKALFPFAGDARLAAGGPPTDDTRGRFMGTPVIGRRATPGGPAPRRTRWRTR